MSEEGKEWSCKVWSEGQTWTHEGTHVPRPAIQRARVKMYRFLRLIEAQQQNGIGAASSLRARRASISVMHHDSSVVSLSMAWHPSFVVPSRPVHGSVLPRVPLTAIPVSLLRTILVELMPLRAPTYSLRIAGGCRIPR